MVNWKGAAAAAALLIVLGVYAYVTRSQPASTLTTNPFIVCNSSNTLDLTVASRTKTVGLARASIATPWQSAQGEVDAAQVNQLLDMFGSTFTVSSISQPGDLAKYGLAPPAVVVTCRVVSGASVNLSLGDQSFDASGDYVQKMGDARVYVISGDEVVRFEAFLGGPKTSTPSP